MDFEKLYEGRTWPLVKGRLGVMSIDTLNRIWEFVLEEDGYLIAIAKNGEDALLGRMGKRDDGKFCIELVVKAAVENNTLGRYQYWFVDSADKQRYAQWLHDVIRDHLV
ncbi:hypothetical protein [Paraburkholderia silvatlantica]|uniref:hypothetical protein n=1 Tax=Paraburkholderia silvatlantica TaxID=321895 RepID=UPI0010613E67|nr:hypothetical protein [Paraburkholderia silvatlantica]TDR04455.1 hypothetical protein C7412_102366 [Paraburkholderia silvatlantica]